MRDYVIDIFEFEASVELYLAKRSHKMYEESEDVSSSDLLGLIQLIELIDSFEDFSQADLEKAISYLTDKYCILPSAILPFDKWDETFVVGSSSGILLPHYHDVTEINNFNSAVTNIVNTILGSMNLVAALEEDVLVVGTSSGAITDGMLLEKGLTFTDYIKRKYTKELFHNYVQPVVRLSMAGVDSIVEVGTTITPTLQFHFSRNNAGELSSLSLRRNEVTIHTGTTLNSFVDSKQIGDESISYNATINYSEGSIINSNLGNPSPYHILAGSKVTEFLNVTGTRRGYYGTDKDTQNEVEVQGAYSILGLTTGSTFDVLIPKGSNSVFFSYRGDARAVSSVKYVEAAMTEIKGVFTETSLVLGGVGGYLPISYRVYTFNFLNPVEQDITYRVTI
jgi:hypothetical protein